jgi:hypothetical protein
MSVVRRERRVEGIQPREKQIANNWAVVADSSLTFPSKDPDNGSRHSGRCPGRQSPRGACEEENQCGTPQDLGGIGSTLRSLWRRKRSGEPRSRSQGLQNLGVVMVMVEQGQRAVITRLSAGASVTVVR